MKRFTPTAFVVAIVLSYLAGHATSPAGSAAAQQAATAQVPAPQQAAGGPPRYAQITLAPDKGDTYHWSIDDIKKAHMAAAANPRYNLGGALARPITRTHLFNFRHTAQSADNQPGDGEEHTGVSELHIILGGSATAFMGGELLDKRTSPERPGEFNGRVKSTQSFKVKAGDIVNIPPGTPHVYQPDGPEGVTYMLVKINVGLFPWSLVAGAQ